MNQKRKTPSNGLNRLFEEGFSFLGPAPWAGLIIQKRPNCYYVKMYPI